MKSFRIKNIKSFLDSGTIDIAPLTIFVGQNSCGKSTLLRFPVVLAQSFFTSNDTSLVLAGKYVDYGFFRDVVHNQSGETISYEFSYDVDINEKSPYGYFISRKERKKEEHVPDIRCIKMCMEIMEEDKAVSVKSVSMTIDNRRIVCFGKNAKEKYVELFARIDENNNISGCKYHFGPISTMEFKEGGFPYYDTMDLFSAIYSSSIGIGRDKIDNKTVSSVFDKLSINDESFGNKRLTKEEKRMKKIMDSFDKISTIMRQIYACFRDDAIRMDYIGPFRDAPSRIYRDSETSSNASVGVRGENTSDILIRDYRKNRKLITDISKWIEPTLGYKITVDDVGNGYFQISLVNKQGLHSNISDVGYGVSQVLPIVTQIIRSTSRARITPLSRRDRSVPIFIEQPELHLHPAAQSKLADLFANYICRNSSSQICVETHSEHLIRKLQVLISDSKNPLTSDMVKIYYVSKNARGNATVREMKIAENGKFETEWPSGFFDQSHMLTMDLLRNSAESV